MVVGATHWGVYVDGFVDVNLDPVQSLKGLANAWNANGFLFGTDTGFWQSNIFVTATYAFLMGFCKVGLPYAERIWLFALVVFAGYSITYLVRTLYPELRVATLFAPAFFVLNIPFYTSLKEGSTYALTSYCALPLELGLIIVAARGGSIRRCALLLGTLVALFANSNPPLNVMSDALLVAAVFAMMLFRVASLARLTKLLFAIGGTIVLMSCWWLLPLVQFLHGYYLPAFNGEGIDLQSQSSHFANEFRGMGLWAFGASPAIAGDAYFGFAAPYISNPIVVFLSFVPPFCAVLALWFATLRNRASAIAFSAMGAGALILASAAYPGGDGTVGNWSASLYKAIYEHVPLFASFRASYKWQTLVQLWIAVIGSAGAAKLVMADMRGKPWLYAVRALPYLAIGGMAGPVLVLGVFTQAQLIPRVPDYWTRAGEYSRTSTAKDARFFVLPDQSFANYIWGQARGDILTPLFHRSAFSDFIGPSRSRNLSNLTHFAFSASVWDQRDETLLSVLRISSASHLLQRYDFDWNGSGGNGNPLQQALQVRRVPHRESQTFGPLVLDRIVDASPSIYTADRAVLLADETELEGRLRAGSGERPALVDAAGLGPLAGSALVSSPTTFTSMISTTSMRAATLAIATSDAGMCTGMESRLTSIGGPYEFVLQDRSLGQTSDAPLVEILIDGKQFVTASAPKRVGDFLVFGTGILSRGPHACRLVNTSPGQDVRLFVVPSSHVAQTARGLISRVREVGVVATVDPSQGTRTFSFDVAASGDYSIRSQSAAIPVSIGTSQKFVSRSAAISSNALPTILGEGFAMNEPLYQGFVPGLPAINTTLLRSMHWMGAGGTFDVFAPSVGDVRLRFRAVAVTKTTHLRIRNSKNALIADVVLRRNDDVRNPVTIKALGAGRTVEIKLSLRTGWNRFNFASTGRLAQVTGLIEPASIALWDVRVSSSGLVSLPDFVGTPVAQQLGNPTLQFAAGVPTMLSLKTQSVPIVEIGSLRPTGLRASSATAQVGILFRLTDPSGKAPDTWVQVPIQGPGSPPLYGASLDLSSFLASDAEVDPSRTVVNAAYFYTFDATKQVGLAAFGQTTVGAARPVASTTYGSHWRLIGRAVRSRVTVASPLAYATLVVRFAPTGKKLPELELHYSSQNHDKVYYPGLACPLENFVRDLSSRNREAYRGKFQEWCPPQLDEHSRPRAMWLLRDEVPLKFVVRNPSRGEWSLVSTERGWFAVVDGRDVAQGHALEIVTQPATWFKSDGILVRAEFPPVSFDRLTRSFRAFDVVVRSRGEEPRRIPVGLQTPELLEGVSLASTPVTSPRVELDGRAISGPSDHIRYLHAGRHLLRIAVRANERGVVVVEPIGLSENMGSSVRSVRYGNGDNIAVELRKSQKPNVLVFSQTFDPGWVASVAGKALPHFRVNYAFNGFVVPAGADHVELNYARPKIILAVGRAISLLTLFALSVCVLWEFRYLRRKNVV